MFDFIKYPFLLLPTVEASQLYKHDGRTQTVSSGAALSMQAMSDDFASIFEGSDAFKNSAAEISEIKNWEPANLYIFTRGTPKVFVGLSVLIT